MNDQIVIEPYHPKWPKMAHAEIERINSEISDSNIIAVQHVGSTSIPNCQAKPIIDIYVAVQSIGRAKKHLVEPITQMGYVYWAENPNPEKMFFVKGMPPYGEKRTHHMHIVQFNSAYWRDCIAFRDYLRMHPEEAKAYSELKIDLAAKYLDDREAYSDAKGEFVSGILRSAGIQEPGGR